jgi:hypothetical protein
MNGLLTRMYDFVVRFWGWEENAAEVEKDKAEMQQRIAEGKPLYGDTQLSPYLQSVAAGNSRNAQLKFSKSIFQLMHPPRPGDMHFLF